MSYSEKLKNPKWQQLRLRVFERDKFKCVLCGDSIHELQVHHEQYTGEPWDCPMEHLKTLCCDCHKGISLIEKHHFKLPNFPDKSFKHVTHFPDKDNYTLDKISFKIGDTLFILYFATGQYEHFSANDISNFYHLMLL